MDKRTEMQALEKPFVIKLGFDKLISQLENSASVNEGVDGVTARDILESLNNKDILRKGLHDLNETKLYKDEIASLLSVLFPRPLLKNEIKVAVPPLSMQILYATDRFQSIFGLISELPSKEFEDVDPDMMYIYMCTFILMKHYGISIQSNVPPVYEVEDSRGIIKYYKSTYNADFIMIEPIGEAPAIDNAILSRLKDDYENLELWKELFPPNSWEVSGFGLRSFTHVSYDEVLSRVKNMLIGSHANRDKALFKEMMNSHMSTLLDVPNVEANFIVYDNVKKEFAKTKDNDKSFALQLSTSCNREDLMCSYGIEKIFEEKKDFITPDVDLLPKEAFDIRIYRSLRDQGIKSYIMTPLYHEDELLGVLEFASKENGAFDKTHHYKIEGVKSLCINSIRQYLEEWKNQLSAVIQHEFTSIHPSVEWKFNEEAENALKAQAIGENYNFDNITFSNLTALYGQMDISGSSKARNDAIAADLKAQMTLVRKIVDRMSEVVSMPLLENIRYQIGIICEKLSSDLAAGMEQEVIEFLRKSINPLLQQMRHRDEQLESSITSYFEMMGEGMEIIYDKRKDYDESVKMINLHIANRMDQEQVKAQKIYPHYFERYKTDGVEHNIFIGQELAPNIPYDKLYLDNLRLWQLKTICELEIEHHKNLDQLPVPLKVASLIMIYSNPLAIRYRMDEKQFDIDGAYNARYEIIKKRIDKAHIKGTDERITQPGKIVMIYTQPSDLEEYLNYVNFLTYENYLIGEPEIFEIEDLQGVVGLKGLRVSVNFNHSDKSPERKKEGETEKVIA